MTQPWIAPFARWFAETDPRGEGRLDVGRLNAFAAARGLRLEDGAPVRFVAARERADAPYESVIAATGTVPTRVEGPGMLHDWFNALCWLRWPAIKARMNRLQATAIREATAKTAGAPRGPLRDAVTLFDESGALFVTVDEQVVARWRGFDWNGLFVAGRSRFQRRVRVFVVGHALLEKLLAPYKGVCAHALLAAPTSGAAAPMAAAGIAPAGSLDALDALDALDRRVAAGLDAGTLAPDRLTPLPLLGIPGWWPGNEDPAFYNDPAVFRARRHRRSRS
ncbi:MAG: DUF3025 domain-containing protein [Gammaproteobacteria bacterium]